MLCMEGIVFCGLAGVKSIMRRVQNRVGCSMTFVHCQMNIIFCF